MSINNVVGLFAALIGTTATLLGAWAYIRSQHTPKKEMFRAALAITVIMICILGCAVAISHATTITVNGQDTIPVPRFFGLSTPGTSTPTLSHTPTLTPTPTSSPTSTPTLTPTPTLTSTPILAPASTPTTP
jgi:hypothetical protein